MIFKILHVWPWTRFALRDRNACNKKLTMWWRLHKELLCVLSLLQQEVLTSQESRRLIWLCRLIQIQDKEMTVTCGVLTLVDSHHQAKVIIFVWKVSPERLINRWSPTILKVLLPWPNLWNNEENFQNFHKIFRKLELDKELRNFSAKKLGEEAHWLWVVLL